MVSDEDFERVNQFKWCAYVGKYSVYARRGIRGGDGRLVTEHMHRFILGVTDPRLRVDHVFHNGLDNQRENLRIATCSQNCRNQRVRVSSTTGYKGVSLDKRSGTYRAYYGIGGKIVNIGSFDCPVEAARHYNKSAADNGEGFELLNDVDPLFPLTQYISSRAMKAEKTRLRTEAHMANGSYSVKHVGISFDKGAGKWRVKSKGEHIGFFLTHEEAVMAQTLKAKQK